MPAPTETSIAAVARDLIGPFDLAAPRSREQQSFQMATEYVHFAPDGSRVGNESFELDLWFSPAGSGADGYTCARLTVRSGDGSPITIPELTNWTYTFDPSLTGASGNEPLWGIPHDRFEALTDGFGRALPFTSRYAAYTNFIDFHSINDVFTKPMPFGKGIQDLKTIGDRVVHLASFVEAQVHFGTEIKPGSTFTNGEVTLELKGLSLVDGRPCALVAYDAGESKLKMILATADGEAVTKGTSHYRGDIHLDLATRVMRKATLDEYLLSEIEASGSTLPNYTVRHIAMRSI